jgi:hypothetical protein
MAAPVQGMRSDIRASDASPIAKGQRMARVDPCIAMAEHGSSFLRDAAMPASQRQSIACRRVAHPALAAVFSHRFFNRRFTHAKPIHATLAHLANARVLAAGLCAV